MAFKSDLLLLFFFSAFLRIFSLESIFEPTLRLLVSAGLRRRSRSASLVVALAPPVSSSLPMSLRICVFFFKFYKLKINLVERWHMGTSRYMYASITVHCSGKKILIVKIA